MDKISCITTSWKEMQDYAKKTSEAIKKSDFHPNVIIGLSRGGLVPARMFCDYLQVKNCYTIKVDHWGVTATKDGKAKLSQKLNMDLTGKNVLIVDDITDTGQSMELAKKHIESLSPKELKTATLLHLTNSKYTPDFFGHERDWAWIIFPWNEREDLVNLIGKIIEKEELAVGKIKEKLQENNGVSLDEDSIREILEHIRYLDKVEKK